MSIRAVHQVLATLGYGDAIGHEVLGIQRVLRAAGYESDIFVETADPRLEPLTRDYRELVDASHPDNLLLHHFSIGSQGVADRVRAAGSDGAHLPQHHAAGVLRRRPPARWRAQCFRGRRELARLRRPLRSRARRLRVQPPGSRGARISAHRRPAGRAGLLASRPARRTGCRRRQFDDEWTNILFVGRVIANKKIEDLIRFFHAYHTHFNPRSRLLIVGALRAASSATWRSLHQLVAALGHAARAFRRPRVATRSWSAFYEVADLFLCASEHEGFCVPLVEAFYKQVPVLAYAATAVPVDDGRRRACCTTTRIRVHVAALMDAIVSNAALAGSRSSTASSPRVDRLQREGLRRHAARLRRSRSCAAPRAPRAAGRRSTSGSSSTRAQALEELRLYRPAHLQGLPVQVRSRTPDPA